MNIQLNCDQLCDQLMRSKDTNYSKYVYNLLNKYCINLQNIMIFWDCIENMKQLKNYFVWIINYIVLIYTLTYYGVQ